MKLLIAIVAICWACASATDAPASASDSSSVVSLVEPSDGTGEFAAARALIETKSSLSSDPFGETPEADAPKTRSRESRQLGEDPPPTEPAPEDGPELTEQERLDILQELERLNGTEPEQLPQPEMFISHVRNYWRRQEEAQQKIRNEILDMILPRKKVSRNGRPMLANRFIWMDFTHVRTMLNC